MSRQRAPFAACLGASLLLAACATSTNEAADASSQVGMACSEAITAIKEIDQEVVGGADDWYSTITNIQPPLSSLTASSARIWKVAHLVGRSAAVDLAAAVGETGNLALDFAMKKSNPGYWQTDVVDEAQLAWSALTVSIEEDCSGFPTN